MNELLRALLNCGDADIDFLLDQFEAFDVDITDAVEKAIDYDHMNFGTLLYKVYEIAYNKALFNVYADTHLQRCLLETDFSINYLDSHFYVIFDGDTQKFYNIAEFNKKLDAMSKTKSLKKQKAIWNNN